MLRCEVQYELEDNQKPKKCEELVFAEHAHETSGDLGQRARRRLRLFSCCIRCTQTDARHKQK